MIPRRFKKFRHKAKNIVTLCWECHRKAHDKPREFELWLCREHTGIWKWWKRNMVLAQRGLDPED